MDKIKNSPEIIFRGIFITFMYLESFAIVLLYQKKLWLLVVTLAIIDILFFYDRLRFRRGFYDIHSFRKF